MSNNILVSVIIPVFNDVERLKICLKALSQQTLARALYEVIVVDNGSDDLEKVRGSVALFENIVLAHEPIQGSYAARNKGLSLAKGEIIAFTDADCIPAQDWLEQGVFHLNSNPDCGQVVGNIEIFFADPRRPTMGELYDSVTAFRQEISLLKFHFGCTANVFTWRRVFDTVGKFNAQLKSGGDLEWGQRVYMQGYRQIYAESVLVRHPARASLRELCNRTRRVIGGHYDLQVANSQNVWKRQIIFGKLLLKQIRLPVFFTKRIFLDCRLHGITQKFKVLWVKIIIKWVSTCELLRLKLGGISNRG